MTKHSRPRLIGWLATESMTSAEAANAAIKMAAETGKTCLVQLDRLTGKMVLTSRDADELPDHFIRGVSHASDPDVLEYDLRTEAVECKLITKPGISRQWDDEEIAQLRTMAGRLPVGVIAKMLERTADSVKNKAKEIGASLHMIRDGERLAKAREIAMRQSALGATMEAAAKAASVSVSTVHRWLKASQNTVKETA